MFDGLVEFYNTRSHPAFFVPTRSLQGRAVKPFAGAFWEGFHQSIQPANIYTFWRWGGFFSKTNPATISRQNS
jgi:predicted NAD/FAD-binding protein